MCSCCCCCNCSVTQQKVWTFLVAALFFVLGLLLVILWPDFATNYTYKMLPLSPGSLTYAIWSDLPVPLYMYIYLYNWTNPEDVRTAGVKPHFEEVGPFVYREKRAKQNVTWYENKTLSFYPQRTWYFEEEMSGAKLDALITAPHLPSMAASAVMRDEPTIIKIGFNRFLNKRGGALYKTYTANQWLFEGFYDELLDSLLKLNSSHTGGGRFVSNEFAWFMGRNGSQEMEGLFTIHSGQGDLRQMGDIKFWNGLNHTGYFEDECGRVNGSTTDLWVPNRGHDEYISVFVKDTCRLINLVPSAEVKLHGIDAIKYETKPDTFDNGQLNADMKCYCPKDMQASGNCPASGATNLATCYAGVPMYLSHPHFMYADASYAQTISGMQPDYAKHNLYIIMEPKLGIPLEANANVMISMHMRKDKDITILRDINEFYAPVFTIATRGAATADLARQIKLILNLPAIGFWIGIALVSIGGIIGLVGIYLTVTHNWRGEVKFAGF